MHTVVIRADIYRRNRWIARSLTDAFNAARAAALNGMAETAALRYMLPWLPADLDYVHSVLGRDYWTYGLAGNESALATMIRYSHEQALIPEQYAPERLFAPETLEQTVV
jgi:4,5-dihydroxyphthalate decarboxylase